MRMFWCQKWLFFAFCAPSRDYIISDNWHTSDIRITRLYFFRLLWTMISTDWRWRALKVKSIEWKLLTNIPVVCNDDGIEKPEWYAHRCKIETFHNILKSGSKAEDSELRTTERLSKLILCFCIISWRVFWLTMVGRGYSDVPAEMAPTQAECEWLDTVIKDNKKL